MIYLDNAATTFPKPSCVRQAVAESLVNYGGNPGRSGHSMSVKCSSKIFDCRSKAADFFGVPDVENVIFTHNCTMALNTAIKGFLKNKSGNVIISCYEHNSVIRPLHKLQKEGNVSCRIADVSDNDDETVENFRKLIDRDTILIAVTHASNVCGRILPVDKLSRLSKEYNISFLLDAAQTAGIIPINLQKIRADFLCLPGHKGMYGPPGSGLLIVRDSKKIDSIIEGGTGSSSLVFEQPSELPDLLESGTQNISSIMGLEAGIDFVSEKGIKSIAEHESNLVRTLYDHLSYLPEIRLYSPPPTVDTSVGTLSFNIQDTPSESVSSKLSESGIAVRAGLHCSPLAHQKLGTYKQGTVRVSVSVFNSMNDIYSLVKNIKKIVLKK